MNMQAISAYSNTSEMTAFAEQISLPLLNDILAFIQETAEAALAQRAELQRRCILLTGGAKGLALQEKYGFLYLGELLERYEERFGMSLPERRAIALALGYARDMTTSEMFVGNQQLHFLQEVRRLADGDIYLAGALYLLSEGQKEAPKMADRLRTAQYQKTEEAIFALSLFPDMETAFPAFKQSLLHLLGHGRNMPVFGNTCILERLAARLLPATKSIRTKDMALFRALCALRTSFIKAGSRQYALLLEHGYTPLEIVYANSMAVLYPSSDRALNPRSIITERLIVSLFREVLSNEASLAPVVYAQLSLIFPLYETFSIKCCGCHKLLDALQERAQIRNAETFIWFSRYAPIYHPVFSRFDLMDSAWNALAGGMAPDKYLSLFEYSFAESMSVEELLNRIKRYDTLTGSNYLDSYWESGAATQFSFFVKKGIIDLWNAFQSSLDKEGTVIHPQMLARIQSYLHELRTVQAFRFLKRFLPQYGFDGLQKYFPRYHYSFADGLVDYYGYSGNPLKFKLNRDYLEDDEEGRRFLLQWVEEYTFHFQTDKHVLFICTLLLNDSAAELLPRKQLRALFDLIICQNMLSTFQVNQLKQRYLTEAEQQAERESREAAERERKRQHDILLLQEVRETYCQETDQTLESLLKFMDRYSHRPALAGQLVYAGLDELLQGSDYLLVKQDILCLFKICVKLMQQEHMSFPEAQDYILKVKEVSENGTGTEPAD